jgi:Kdo2-lipid IVA lauroyltransferase/acyltransferase
MRFKTFDQSNIPLWDPWLSAAAANLHRSAIRMVTRAGILVMVAIGRLPLAWIRALGFVVGSVIYTFAARRRHVVWTNIRLCFPSYSVVRQRKLVKDTFVHVAQAWLDRSWLWHGDPRKPNRRLRICGAVAELSDDLPLVLFAPHFVGMDAGWTALTQQISRNFCSIYTRQRDPQVDQWIEHGRRRFGKTMLFERRQGVKTIVSSLRNGHALYLLPDMNFGPQESIFVPFYGVQTATLTSLSRFARLGRAKVVPVVTRMTRQGYDVRIHEAWSDFPGPDASTDAAVMNARLQTYIDEMPDQYYWVHRRFKTRPAGEPPAY